MLPAEPPLLRPARNTAVHLSCQGVRRRLLRPRHLLLRYKSGHWLLLRPREGQRGKQGALRESATQLDYTSWTLGVGGVAIDKGGIGGAAYKSIGTMLEIEAGLYQYFKFVLEQCADDPPDRRFRDISTPLVVRPPKAPGDLPKPLREALGGYPTRSCVRREACSCS